MNKGSETPHSWEPVTSGQQLFTFIEAHFYFVVFFTAPWCFRCKQIEPKIAGFPTDYPEIKFCSVDLDSVSDIGDLLNISTLPTFVLYRDGVEVHRLEGVPQQRPARALAQALKTHVLKNQ